MTFHVTKRDGSLQDLNTQNIMMRVKNVSTRFNINVPLTDCCMKVVDQLYNKINTSEKFDSSGNRNMLQNHLKDLVHFKSVTNNPMFNLYGTESDIKLEYYDPSGDSWSKRVEPIEMIYNTARLAYKSDEVYVRSIINSDENTPERDMSGVLIKNDKYMEEE